MVEPVSARRAARNAAAGTSRRSPSPQRPRADRLPPLIQGGQGRSPEQLRRDATAIVAAVAVVLGVLLAAAIVSTIMGAR